MPCFTLRENTERPITIFEGTNTLVGDNMEKLKNELSDLRNAKKRPLVAHVQCFGMDRPLTEF